VTTAAVPVLVSAWTPENSRFVASPVKAPRSIGTVSLLISNLGNRPGSVAATATIKIQRKDDSGEFFLWKADLEDSPPVIIEPGRTLLISYKPQAFKGSVEPMDLVFDKHSRCVIAPTLTDFVGRLIEPELSIDCISLDSMASAVHRSTPKESSK
jgi:hypothetical protein